MKSIVANLLFLGFVLNSPLFNSSSSAQDSSPDKQTENSSDDQPDKQTHEQPPESVESIDFVFVHSEKPSIYADNASFYYELKMPKNTYDCQFGGGSLAVVMTSKDGIENKGTYSVKFVKCVTKDKWGEGKFVKCKKYKLISGQDVLKSSASRTSKLPKKGSIMHLYTWDRRDSYEIAATGYEYNILSVVSISTKSGNPIFPQMLEKGKKAYR